MTERAGGSDVGYTETIARRDKDGVYRLRGYKFFTSATTSPIAFALARVENNGQTIKVRMIPRVHMLG